MPGNYRPVFETHGMGQCTGGRMVGVSFGLRVERMLRRHGLVPLTRGASLLERMGEFVGQDRIARQRPGSIQPLTKPDLVAVGPSRDPMLARYRVAMPVVVHLYFTERLSKYGLEPCPNVGFERSTPLCPRPVGR